MPEMFIYAFLGGFLPALFWLWFWLRQDSRCPEPRSLIFLAFIAGMVAVPIVIPFEKWAQGIWTGTTLIIVWAAIEEVAKLALAYVAVLRRKALNEPVDAVIYMITVALGFAALENTLFLLDPLLKGDILVSITTGNLRFLGATLLHTVSSAVIGIAIAFSFYKKKKTRRTYLFTGVILAIVLHALFNFFIIESSGEKILYVFFGVWVAVLALILSFEHVKRIKRPQFLKKRRYAKK